MPRKVTVTEKHRQVARDYVSGKKSFQSAMKDAGYTDSWSRQGPRAVSRRTPAIAQAINDELDSAVEAANGADLAPARLEKLMMHRLMLNLARGKDEATHSAKLVGSLKTIDAFVRADSAMQGGIFAFLGTPEALAMLQKLDAALPEEPASSPASKETKP